MAYQDFGGAVMPAMAGFFFRTKAKVQGRNEELTPQLPAVIKVGDTDGVTGVSKYLATIPLVTSVAKYIKKQEKQPVSGVEKYILRQTIRDRNAPPPSSVAKYLAKQEKESPAKSRSSVDRYLLKQDLAARQFVNLTGVAKYQAEQDLIEKKKAAAALIQRYRDEEIAKAREAEFAAYDSARIDDYIQTEIMDQEAPATTRVGRYLQEKNRIEKNKPKPSGVAKYIARKIAVDSQKPELSGVAKYLQTKKASPAQRPHATGVARYIAQQKPVANKEKVAKLPLSGVAKYLTDQNEREASKPALSKVAKYLEKQARLELENNKLTLLTHVTQEKLVAIEGEFIPADQEEASVTGVARYLARQDFAANNTTESGSQQLTGVAKYLQKKSASASSVVNAASTGVDRYLLRKAS
jgi:hypothetical protein